MEMCTASWDSLCYLVPVFILRPPADNPALVSPPNQEAAARPTLQTQVKNWYLAQGTPSRTDLCPTGCIPCSDGNLAGWLSLDNSGDRKVNSLSISKW